MPSTLDLRKSAKQTIREAEIKARKMGWQVLAGLAAVGISALAVLILIKAAIFTYIVVGSILVIAGIYGYSTINNMSRIIGRYSITAEKQNSAIQAKNEGKFKALIQNSQDVILIVAPNGNVIYQSPSVERVLGYPADSLIGLTFYELIHTEDHCILENAFNQKASTFVS
ncbi:MAG: PAS domain-containing protein, partial [Bacteroidia bacterium]|nr:PAS domain-containing protein [Bacteroidia bacterium]